MTGDRLVTLVLVTAGGDVLGSLDPFVVPSPWWQEVSDVVGEARRTRDVEVTILRLLEASRGRPPGGAVTYLAEVRSPVPAESWSGRLVDHPMRLPWARPGGPTADLAWATRELERAGRRLAGAPKQIRTWNLSSIWRLPATGGDAWLKCVPPFFAHEGRAVEHLAAFRVPRLIAHDEGRILTEAIGGDDLYGASGARLDEMVSLLVDLQVRLSDDIEPLLALGLPDHRDGPLTTAIGLDIDGTRDELGADDVDVLLAFLDGLPERFAALADCGLPTTLVHGDFHPGNLRGDAEGLTLLDWGDCVVGHPLLDQAAFLDRIPRVSVGHVEQHWHDEWRRAVPGADPERAAELIRPLAAARMAVVYRAFLDAIEPSEQPYHRADPAEWLHRTASILRAERP